MPVPTAVPPIASFRTLSKAFCISVVLSLIKDA